MNLFSASFPFPLHSVLIWQDGSLLEESYYEPCRREDLHRMFSVTKSFAALSIGGLIAEGKLALSGRIIDYFPEYVPEDPHPYLASMTIGDMLTMRTCHKATTYKINMAENWVRSFFITPPDHRPGTVFKYDTSSAHTLAALVKKLSGKGLLGYLREIFPAELHFSEDASVLTDPFGAELGGSGLLARSSDLLEVGKFLLACLTGTWKADYPSVSADPDGFYERWASYIKRALSCLVPTVHQGKTLDEWQGYGFQFWQVRDGVMMYGMGGQYVVIYPDTRLVVVTTADSQAVQGGTQYILDEIHRVYLALGGREKCASHISLFGASAAAHLPADLPGRYEFAKNPQGFASCEIDENRILLINKGKTYVFPLENENPGSFSSSKDPGYGQELKVWSSVLGGSLYLYVQIFGEYLGSIRMLLTASDGKLTVHMNRIEETVLREFDGFLEGTKIE